MKLVALVFLLVALPALAAPAKAPRLVLGKRVSTGNVRTILFTKARLVFAEEDDKTSGIVDIDLATGAKKDLYRTKEQMVGYECDATVSVCVIALDVGPHGREMLSTGDVTTLLLLEGTHTTPLAIPGVPHPFLIDLSPDARYVLVREEMASDLFAYDRTTRTLISLSAKPKEALWVDSWTGTTPIVWRQPQDPHDASTYVAWNLGDGSTKPAARHEDMPVLSPNKQRAAIVALGPPVVTVTQDGKVRTRALTEKEAENLALTCEWLDDRWLVTPAGFIDTNTMTFAPLPPAVNGFETTLEYVHGSRTVLYSGAHGYFLGTLVGP
ncbi:MAG TPA: hypothetical protein VGM39_18865 [Kofleriaceae bacterium]|jgi:hypothetical protein